MEQPDALDRAVAGDLADLKRHVQVDVAGVGGRHDLVDGQLVRAEALAAVSERHRLGGVDEVDDQSQAESPPPMIITRLPANSDF